MRCLSLAQALRDKGASIHFICRELDGHLGAVIRANGHELSLLPAVEPEVAWEVDAQRTEIALQRRARPDWLVVDHYALDAHWEQRLSAFTDRILVLDDLADRPHECHALLDQNVPDQSRYAGKVPPDCRLLTGPHYALLRADFASLRRQIHPRSGVVRRILVSFGGADESNRTMAAIEALGLVGRRDIAVDVVIGAQNPHGEIVRAACAERGFSCHVQTDRMAQLMADADLAIGAGGVSNWERCCLGLPGVVFALADNQRPLLRYAALEGLLYAPDASPDDPRALALHISACLQNPMLLEAISRKALAAVDGRGPQRVLRAMGVGAVTVRAALPTDAALMFEWRNHPLVRQMSRTDKPLDWSAHLQWLEGVQQDPRRTLLMGEAAGRPVGVVRFDVAGDDAEISIYVDPNGGGAGWGSELLMAAEQWLKQNRPEVRHLRAEVLRDNLASHRLFGGADYRREATTYSRRIG